MEQIEMAHDPAMWLIAPPGMNTPVLPVEVKVFPSKDKRKGMSIYPSEKAKSFVLNLKRMTGLKITRIMENALELYHEKIIEDQGLQIDTSKL